MYKLLLINYIRLSIMSNTRLHEARFVLIKLGKLISEQCGNEYGPILDWHYK